MEEIRLGKIIHSLSHLIKRRLDESEGLQKAQRVTGTNGWIIGFLANRQDREVFQKDVEKELTITRSTASRILSLMEEKGLLERQAVDYDARLKRLKLTDRAMDIHLEVSRDIDSVEECIMKGFTDEEISTLAGYLERIKTNLEGK